MVDGFEVAGDFGLSCLFGLRLNSIDEFLGLHFLGQLGVEPVDGGHVGTEIEAQRGVVAEEARCVEGVFGVDEQGMLRGGAAVVARWRTMAAGNRRLRSPL